jgi:flagellar assembly protein FliH
MDDTDFKPLDIGSLETFEREHINQTDTSQPDFSRFKLLVDKARFEPEETIEFEALIDLTAERNAAVFKPLIEPRKKPAPADKMQGVTADLKDPVIETPTEPELTPEEKGYQAGFEKGFEQGVAQGQQQGYSAGVEKGHAEGFEKGLREGVEKGTADGFEQGFKAGEEKGTAETREQGHAILSSLEESLKAADQTLELLVDKYEPRILSLIQQIAKKAILVEIETNDEIVRAMVLDALKSLVEPEVVSLSVCPEDYEYIEMVKDDFFDEVDTLTRISVRSDPSIKRGGCKIDTLTASVSADPESRFSAIAEALKKAGEK